MSLEKYPRLQGWLKRCQSTMPDYKEVNEKGIEMMRQFFTAKHPDAFKNFHWIKYFFQYRLIILCNKPWFNQIEKKNSLRLARVLAGMRVFVCGCLKKPAEYIYWLWMSILIRYRRCFNFFLFSFLIYFHFFKHVFACVVDKGENAFTYDVT